MAELAPKAAYTSKNICAEAGGAGAEGEAYLFHTYTVIPGILYILVYTFILLYIHIYIYIYISFIHFYCIYYVAEAGRAGAEGPPDILVYI